MNVPVCLPMCMHTRCMDTRQRSQHIHDACCALLRTLLCRYGYKQDATRLLQEWVHDIGSAAGMTAANTRLSSGAIGAPESRLEVRPSHLYACLLQCWCLYSKWANVQSEQLRGLLS